MPEIVRLNGKPDSKRITRHSLVYDAYPRYLTDSPSPSKFAALLKRVDQGELSELCILQQEMERKSDQFHGVCQTRRNAVTALEWRIEPDPRADQDDTFAKEVADYCEDKLVAIDSWPDALRSLSDAIGPNLAVVELVWSEAEIAEFIIVPCTRFVAHPILNTGVAIRTDQEYMGLPTDAFPGKFMVYVPNIRGGFPFRTTLTHASVNAYLMLHFSRADWLAFSELYGSPIRMGTYTDPLVDDDRATLEDMLNNMGSDTAAFFPQGVEVELKQATGTGETYPNQCEYADSKLAILWLGQTLTTDVGGTGSYAAAKVHDNVRGDLLASDLQAEAACIRRQLLAPMVALKFPGRDAPVPVFKRKTYIGRDVEVERLTLDQVREAAKLKLSVSSDWLYEALAIPRPETDIPDVIQLGESEPEETVDDGTDPVPGE